MKRRDATTHWERLADHFADELVERWHMLGELASDMPLHEFMGLTQEQYAAWVECRFEEVLDA